MSERPRQGFRLPCRGQFAWLALARCSSAAHACAMFSVDEATAAAIRQVFEESGELSAVVELRRHFPGIKDNAAARLCVRAPAPEANPDMPYQIIDAVMAWAITADVALRGAFRPPWAGRRH
jgi:hypothetical protein